MANVSERPQGLIISDTDQGLTKNTTRTSAEGRTESFLLAIEDRPLDYRLSRRRSSTGKYLMPRLSIAGPQNRTGHTIKFDVDKDGQTRRTPKKTLTSTLDFGLLSQKGIWDSLELKVGGSTTRVDRTPTPEEPPEDTGSQKCARFTGELLLVSSSKATDKSIPVLPPIWPSGFNSRAVSLGNSSDNSIDTIWPWAWLPAHLNSSEYVSKSKTPTTFHLQEELENFPLMPLQKTLKTFLTCVRVLLRPSQIPGAERLVQELSKLCDENITDQLMKAGSDTSMSSVKSGHWLLRLVPMVSMCLTRSEAPLANTAILAPFMWDLWPERNDSQLDRAVILIQVIADFYRLIQNERLHVLYDEAGYPQCMHQFRKLFSSAKIPGIPEDGTHNFFKTAREPGHRVAPTHIVVIHRGQMFSMEIMRDEFRTVPIVELRYNLQRIIALALELAPRCQRMSCQGVGVLTSMDRDVWSETRVHLMSISPMNRACLQRLEEAIFVLSLDHMNARSPCRLTSEALFGDGCNRWYDKALNFYIYQNGLVTVNVCSALVDASVANVLLRYIHVRILEDAEKWDDEVYKKSGLTSHCQSSECLSFRSNLSQISNNNMSFSPVKSDIIVPPSAVASDDSSTPFTLVFDMDESIEKTVMEAHISFNRFEEIFSSTMCHYVGFDANFLENQRIDMDAFAHLAMQLAFFKMYFRPAAVGSKVSVKRFYHARHDTMITTTEESIGWCRAMLDPTSTHQDRFTLFASAVERHVHRLEEVRAGKGCFHHLAALREIAEEAKEEALVKVLDDMLELPAGSPESVDLSCEGLTPQGCLSVVVVTPPSLSGYGVGYALAKSKALFTVSAWKTNPRASPDNFACILHNCLEDLHKFLSAS